ncbi:MAG: hypothetical protein ACRC2U_19820, partial [Aeromonas sp.]
MIPIPMNHSSAKHWAQQATALKAAMRLLLSVGFVLSSAPSMAQLDPGTTPAATAAAKPAPQANAALEQQYKSCPGGYYNGPRPGRVRYTQDPWMWAVTPAFAKKHCFPAEFVSPDLQGAEAIAVKMHEKTTEIICGWGDNKEVCRPTERKWRFELYVPTRTLPKSRNVPYYNPARLASPMLLTEGEAEFQKTKKDNAANPKPGALGVFTLDQI